MNPRENIHIISQRTCLTTPTSSKIKFELTGYNTPEVTDGDAYYYKAGWIIALLIFGFLFVIGLYIGLYALVAVMAKRRHQFFRKRNVIVFVGRMS